VLGTKTAGTGGYRVTADVVDAYGLTIAGLPDPRVYGGAGASGSDVRAVTDPLERRAVDQALRTADGDAAAGSATPGSPGRTVDVFATHEPVAAAELRAVLGNRIRETASGHVHAQNDAADLQHGAAIDLVEGSTGAGGLDNIYRGADGLPIEFSIESVGTDCQFIRIVRFRIDTPPPGDAADTASAYGDDVTATRVSFRPQDVGGDRSCGTSQGIDAVRPW
jgi:hypothetical protein